MNKETFERKNNDLMNRWLMLKNPDEKGFIWDGIIDFDLWNESDLKLAFFLREA